MKFKNVFSLIFLFLLVGCVPTTPAISTATLTPEATLMPSPTKTATLIPSPTATFSPEQQITAMVNKAKDTGILPSGLNEEQMITFVDELERQREASPIYIAEETVPNKIWLYMPDVESLKFLPTSYDTTLVADKWDKQRKLQWLIADKSILQQADFVKAITPKKFIPVVESHYYYDGQWVEIQANPFGWDTLNNTELKNSPDVIPSDLEQNLQWQQMILIGEEPEIITITKKDEYVGESPFFMCKFLRIIEDENGTHTGEIIYIKISTAGTIRVGNTNKKTAQYDERAFQDKRFWELTYIVPGGTYLIGLIPTGFAKRAPINKVIGLDLGIPKNSIADVLQENLSDVPASSKNFVLLTE